MQLSSKEETLLKDLKGQEQLCADKYTKYSSEACDPQLKNLFSQIAAVEQGHYGTLSKIESGNVPQAPTSSASNSSVMSDFSAKYSQTESTEKKNDCYLCTDLLATEKHASALYDTCIFEFRDENVRSLLSNIQKEEQQHAKKIYDYMAKNSMYS